MDHWIHVRILQLYCQYTPLRIFLIVFSSTSQCRDGLNAKMLWVDSNQTLKNIGYSLIDTKKKISVNIETCLLNSNICP